MHAAKNYMRFVYSLVCYIAGVASLTYLIFFVNDLFLAKTVNSLVETRSWTEAVPMNLLALALFGLQHSIMARRSYKKWITRFIHPSMERSTYVLSTALVIAVMCYLWVPSGEVIWQFDSEVTVFAIRGFAFIGWTLLFIASFMLNHFELFGLSQTFNPMIGKTQPEAHFKTPGIYKIIRHPIQTGVLIGMWSVPLSTTSHFMFASGMTLYIAVGLYFEEIDLIRDFGTAYLDYMKRVKRLIPFVH